MKKRPSSELPGTQSNSAFLNTGASHRRLLQLLTSLVCQMMLRMTLALSVVLAPFVPIWAAKPNTNPNGRIFSTAEPLSDLVNYEHFSHSQPNSVTTHFLEQEQIPHNNYTGPIQNLADGITAQITSVTISSPMLQINSSSAASFDQDPNTETVEIYNFQLNHPGTHNPRKYLQYWADADHNISQFMATHLGDQLKAQKKLYQSLKLTPPAKRSVLADQLIEQFENKKFSVPLRYAGKSYLAQAPSSEPSFFQTALDQVARSNPRSIHAPFENPSLPGFGSPRSQLEPVIKQRSLISRMVTKLGKLGVENPATTGLFFIIFRGALIGGGSGLGVAGNTNLPIEMAYWLGFDVFVISASMQFISHPYLSFLNWSNDNTLARFLFTRFKNTEYFNWLTDGGSIITGAAIQGLLLAAVNYQVEAATGHSFYELGLNETSSFRDSLTYITQTVGLNIDPINLQVVGTLGTYMLLMTATQLVAERGIGKYWETMKTELIKRQESGSAALSQADFDRIMHLDDQEIKSKALEILNRRDSREFDQIGHETKIWVLLMAIVSNMSSLAETADANIVGDWVLHTLTGAAIFSAFAVSSQLKHEALSFTQSQEPTPFLSRIGGGFERLLPIGTLPYLKQSSINTQKKIKTNLQASVLTCGMFLK